MKLAKPIRKRPKKDAEPIARDLRSKKRREDALERKREEVRDAVERDKEEERDTLERKKKQEDAYRQANAEVFEYFDTLIF